MRFTGDRKIMWAMLVIWVLLFCDCGVGAIRWYPQNGAETEREAQTLKANKGEEDLYQKYFSKIGSDLRSNSTEDGFEASKRRVPSCPDPLHN
ncbi:hypothetical protein NMG60_11018965 [Bertholletia excelsa]